MPWGQIRRIAILVILFVTNSLLAQSSRPKIAIKSFKNPANYSRSSIGNGLTEILTTELQKNSKFNVLERSNVDELTKEMDFGDSEYSKKESFAKKGNLLGAQYLLIGKVTNFSFSEQGARQQSNNLFGPRKVTLVYQQRADVRVDFRLIDVTSGETVISEAGEAHKTNTSDVSYLATWRRCELSGSFNLEDSSSLIGKATVEAVKDLVKKLNALSETVRTRSSEAALSASIESLTTAKGSIAAEEGGGLWIVEGIGSANGLRVGDHLRLVHENVVKDKNGKIVYRKSQEIGIMEVTDVSQADHAEARFTPGATQGGAPHTGDTVTVDVDHARGLRGGGMAAAPASGGNATEGTIRRGSGDIESLLKRANDYFHDRFWSQALDQYNQAAAISPGDPRALQGQAISHYMMEDFVEGDDAANKLLQSGSAFSVPIAHYHSFGYCTGQLNIQKGKLLFISQKGDGFELTPESLLGFEVKKLENKVQKILGGGRRQAPEWAVLIVRYRDGSGHEKSAQLIPYLYSKQPSLSGNDIAQAYPMDASDLQSMGKFEESLTAMVHRTIR